MRFRPSRLSLLAALTLPFSCLAQDAEESSTESADASGSAPVAAPVATPVEESDDPTVSAEPTGVPVKLDIARRFLKNFLKDKIALTAYQIAEETHRDFEEAFMIASPGTQFAVIWDPFTCRLAGVLDVEASEKAAAAGLPPSDLHYPLLAAGAAPFTEAIGAAESPKYFGFRLADGKPEFLFLHGALVIEERLWLEDGGKTLKQRFSIRDAPGTIRILVPDAWKERITPSVGEWENGGLSVPKDDTEEVILTYRLERPAPQPQPEPEEDSE